MQRSVCRLLIAFVVLVPHALGAQSAAPRLPPGWSDDPPAIASLVAIGRTESDLRIAVERYLLDKAAIERRYEVPYSPARHARLRTFYDGWRRRLAEADFAALNAEGRLDFVMLRNRIDYDVEGLRLAEVRWKEMAALVPFFDALRALQEERFDRKRADPRATADVLSRVADQASALTRRLAAEAKQAGGLVTRPGVSLAVAARAAAQIDALRTILADWNAFYDGYDPIYSFWAREPYGRLDKALAAYATTLREHLVGIRPGEQAPIVGDPVMADGLEADLAFEMIPYTAEELLAIGEKEFSAIETELRVVSRQMGFGDEWKKALEHTKNLAPPPGENAWVIFDIARYSEDFVSKMKAITLPPLAREVWRLAMQTPERQLINPFFTGGEVTRVSYPTDGMPHEAKLMSMRGNTPHFNFATA